MIWSLLLSTALAGDWDTRHQIGASVFPLGLRYAFRTDYQIPLWNSDSILFEDTYFAPGIYADVSPAYFHVGPRFHFSPIAVLDIQGDFQYGYHFGTFSGITDFDNASDAYTDAALDARAAAGHKGSGSTLKGTLSVTLQAKVSHLIIALPQDFVYLWSKQPEGAGDFWYEPQYDALIAWQDVVMNNSALMFWAFKESSDEDARFFWLGANFNHQYVFGTEDRSIRVGPMAVFKPGTSTAVPSIALFSQVYIENRIHPIVPPYIAGAVIWSY